MANEMSRVDATHAAVARTDSYLSLGEKMWEARNLIAPTLLFGGVVTSALYKVFDFVNQFGWAGWVLAAIPSVVIVALLFLFLGWVLHVRGMRQLRENPEGKSALSQSAPPVQAPPSVGSEYGTRLTKAQDNIATIFRGLENLESSMNQRIEDLIVSMRSEASASKRSADDLEARLRKTVEEESLRQRNITGKIMKCVDIVHLKALTDKWLKHSYELEKQDPAQWPFLLACSGAAIVIREEMDRFDRIGISQNEFETLFNNTNQRTVADRDGLTKLSNRLEVILSDNVDQLHMDVAANA